MAFGIVCTGIKYYKTCTAYTTKTVPKNKNHLKQNNPDFTWEKE